ncbi:EamA family transporter [uncultured Tateyamaria sp.]|uniref:EamA family transporter n=1 Tax=uncultured Tateyamaria sp. TaxID=455651 RepID=UPI0034510554
MVVETIETIPVFQTAFARYAVAALLMLPFMFTRPSLFQMSSPSRYLVRTIAGFGGIALMFAAIQVIPLASATAIGFTSPIFAMVFFLFSCFKSRCRNYDGLRPSCPSSNGLRQMAV